MAIRHIYGPQAGTLAGVAGAIGTGRGQQDAAKQQAELDRMTLGALLQDRSQQADFNFRAAGMYQGAQQQQAQMQNELARQQIAMNLGAQQSAYDAALRGWGMEAGLAQNAWQNQQQLQQQGLMDQQRLDLQRQLGFAELDQQTQLAELRMRPEAQAAWQKIQAEEDAIRRAFQENFLTDDQFQEAMAAHAQQVAGFDINKYQQQEWQQEIVHPDGSKSMGTWQMGPDGKAVPRYDTQKEIDAKWKAWEESQKPQQQSKEGQQRIQEENMVRDDQRTDQNNRLKMIAEARQKLYEEEYERLNPAQPAGAPPRAVKTPEVTDEMVFKRVQRDLALANALGGVSGQSAPTAGIPAGPSTEQLVGMAQQGGQPLPMQPQQPQQLPPPRQAFGLTDLPPIQVAMIAVEQQPQYVANYLKQRYPVVEAVLTSGNPDDVALAEVLLKRGK